MSYKGNLNVYGTHDGKTWTLIRQSVGQSFVDEFTKHTNKWDKVVFSRSAPGKVIADLSGLDRDSR